MNKQEAIEEIKTECHSDKIFLWDVLDIVSQIGEPQKPVIPKFVAEWLEKATGEKIHWEGKLSLTFSTI